MRPPGTIEDRRPPAPDGWLIRTGEYVSSSQGVGGPPIYFVRLATRPFPHIQATHVPEEARVFGRKVDAQTYARNQLGRRGEPVTLAAALRRRDAEGKGV